MSEAAKAARAANKAKAERLAAGDPKAKVDASSYTPPEMMNTEKKTGLRPVSRRQFKRGGKVHGEEAPQNAGRKARKSGGKLPTQIAESHVNRNVKDANAEFGKPHIGGFAKGGYAKGGYAKSDRNGKAGGGATDDMPSLRLMKTIRHPSGKMAKVYKDKDYGEYRTKFFDEDGKHMPKADYHTDDKDDAHDTAQSFLESRTGKMGGGAMGDPRTAAADRMAAANAQSGVPSGRMSFVPVVGSPLLNSGMKKGGRTGKAGGGMMDDDINPRVGSVGSSEFKENQEKTKAPVRYAAKGGKIKNFEGSAKDEAQDKKLAKKYGIPQKDYENSAVDRKHDMQQSMKGLKKGGRAAKAEGGNLDPRNAGGGGGGGGKDFMHAMMPLTMLMDKKRGGRTGKAGGGALDGNYTGGTRPTGGRIARAMGGKAKKGKTNINIVINAGQKPTDPMAGLPPMLPPPPGGPGLPPSMSAVPPAPGGGAPMGPPPGGPAGGLPGGLAGLMGRKAGGRVGNRSYSSYKDMDAGAGGGMGRLEKTEIAKKTYRK